MGQVCCLPYRRPQNSSTGNFYVNYTKKFGAFILKICSKLMGEEKFGGLLLLDLQTRRPPKLPPNSEETAKLMR